METNKQKDNYFFGLIERRKGGGYSLRAPISFKITLPYILLALIFALLATVIVSQLIFDNLKARFQDQLVIAGEISKDLLVNEENELLSILRAISFTKGVSNLISNEDAEGLREIILPMAINQNIDAIEILNLEGTSIMSVRHDASGGIEDYISERGDTIFANWDFVQNVLNQAVDINNEEISNKFAGWESAPWGQLFYVSGPIYSERGDFSGVILVGVSIDKLSQNLRREVGAEAINFYDLEGILFHTTSSLIQNEILTEGITLPDEDFTVFRPIEAGSLQFSEVTGQWIARNGETLGYLGVARAQSQTISAGEESRNLIIVGVFFFFALVVGIGIYISRLITRPLDTVVSGIKKIQEGNLDFTLDVTSNDEFELLSGAFNEMVGGLRTKERMASELNFAKDIQMQMMPDKILKSSLERGFVLRAHLVPAREIGGDFYDFFNIDKKKNCIVIGDVSGKGAPGAMLMAVTKTLIKSLASSGLSAKKIIEAVNEELSKNNPAAMFVTIFLAIFDHSTNTLTYSNAGHNPPLVKRKSGEMIRLDAIHGPMVGPFQGIQYKQDKLNMKPGDSLLIFTDGISEAMDLDSNLFTEEKIKHFFSETNFPSMEILTDKLIEAVADFVGEAEQSDDITMLSMKLVDRSKVNATQGKISITFNNNLQAKNQISELVTNFLVTNSVNASEQRKIQVAIDEMVGNTIAYGYNDEHVHEIILSIKVEEELIKTVIIDDAKQFNPFDKDDLKLENNVEDAKIGGLGIHMTKKLMDKVSYKASLGKNVVTMVKFRS